MLKNDSDAFTRRADRLTINQHLPGARREQSSDASEQCCFATARWTDDAQNLVASYIQLDIAEGDDCSFEEKLTGVVNHNLGAVGHREGVIILECRS